MSLYDEGSICGWSTGDLAQWVVPDLSNVSEEEFHLRLINLKKSHQKLLELCDHVGIKEHNLHRVPSSEEPISDLGKNLFRSKSSNDSLITTNSEHSFLSYAKATEFCGLKRNLLRQSNSDAMLNLKLTKSFRENESVLNLYQSSDKKSFNCGIIKNCNGTKNRRLSFKPHHTTFRTGDSDSNITSSKNLHKHCFKTKTDLENVKFRKTFQALPIPSSTYENLYNEMQENAKLRKQRNLMKRHDFLACTSKPFAFLEREKHKSSIECFEKKDADFKANPFPAHLFSKARDEKLRRAGILRQINSAERSRQLLRTARSLSSMSHTSTRHRCHPNPLLKEKERTFVLRCDAPKLSILKSPCSSGFSVIDFKGYDNSKVSRHNQNSQNSCQSVFSKEDSHKNTDSLNEGSRIPQLESNPDEANTKQKVKNNFRTRNAVRRPVSMRKKDIYWIDEAVKREIEAELEQITL